MPRFKLLIEYAGTRYSGWQVQKNARTVQGEVEKAIREATGADRFELYASSRQSSSTAPAVPTRACTRSGRWPI